MNKNKKILVWSVKGGVGKTNIAAELALRMQYPIITNEKNTMLKHVIPEGRLKILDNSETLPKIDCGVLYDFGGYATDNRVLDAVKESDYILIPTTIEESSIQGCIDTILELRDMFSEKIIIIANRVTKRHNIELLTSQLVNLRMSYAPLFKIKESTALRNIYKKKLSIQEMMQSNKLLKYHYDSVSKQFDKIVAHILK